MTARATCPDCGRPIVSHPSGWWSHEGLPDGCWRMSMDGPNDPDAEQDRAAGFDPVYAEPSVCGGTGNHDGQPVDRCDECSAVPS